MSFDAETFAVAKAYTDSHGGGGGGTSNYNQLSNKPSINNVELQGNKSLSDLGVPSKTSDLTNDSGFITDADIPSKTSDLTNDSGFITLSDIPTIPSKTSDLTNDSGFITANDIPSIPSATSDLTNDSGFITNLVNDLTNYYLKSETYTKAEVNSAIGAITTVHFEVVEELPIHDIDTNVIYLVPNSSSAQNNVYDEYLYINNAWEIIGSTQIDLSNYVQKSQTAGLIKNDGTIDTTQYISQHQDITGKADKVSGATNGNLAGLDANGNLTDSGSKASDFQDADDVMTSADMDEVIDRLPMANSDSIYSLAEQVVGRWIDGKPLYQKTINFGALPNNAEKQVSAGVADLDMIYNGYGIYTNGVDIVNLLSHPWPTEASIDVLSFKKVSNDWKISITTKSDRTGYTGYITIQYIKTTD